MAVTETHHTGVGLIAEQERKSWITAEIPDPVVSTRRADKGRLYGLGIGYRLGETARLGLTQLRGAPMPKLSGSNEGFRAGATVSYGLSAMNSMKTSLFARVGVRHARGFLWSACVATFLGNPGLQPACRHKRIIQSARRTYSRSPCSARPSCLANTRSNQDRHLHVSRKSAA